jgi:molybdenum cofactor cytidylyltransferase
MQFKKVSTSEAERTILAHSLKLQGKRFGKGRILSAQDIRILADAGIDEVTVAILEADDIGEDAAAAEIASRLAGGGTRAGPAFTGRTNLYSTQDGLVAIDRQAID